MTSLKRRIVIGLTGPFGAGCSTIAEDLKNRRAFRTFSLSQAMREMAPQYVENLDTEKLSSPKHRSYQQQVGNTIRAKDIHAIAAKVCDKITAEEKADSLLSQIGIVVDGIRNPAEMVYFRDKFPHFFTVAVFAPKDIRWLRKRDDYDGDQDRFDQDDLKDAGEYEPDFGQAVQLCVDRADILISNDRQFSEPHIKQDLQSKLDLFLSLMEKPGSMLPHTWELHMGQAYHSSLMSTCCKRKVGAVLVKETATDRQASSYVVASGYNEAPITIKTCKQRGGVAFPRYCYKDEQIKKKLRDQYKFCPKCGKPLPTFGESISLPVPCSECNSRLGSDFIPGRMLDLCIAVHAEEAAILQAARLGATAIENSVLYTTTFPCPLCAKKIVQLGIQKVIFAEPYPQAEAVNILAEADIRAALFEGVKGRAYHRLFEQPPA